MPTIAVDKAALFKELGKEYTTEEFDELCFDFGLELDEDTSQSKKPEDLAQPPQLKIEIPANRYDMLCFEGIALNLRVFLEKQKLPKWVPTPPAGGELQTITVKEEVRDLTRCLQLHLEETGLTFCRLREYGRYSPVLSYETSNSHKPDTIPSSRCRTNCTKIWQGSERSYPLEPTIWTVGGTIRLTNRIY
jgi:hypothetical protein